jgi:hypothetical protein
VARVWVGSETGRRTPEGLPDSSPYRLRTRCFDLAFDRMRRQTFGGGRRILPRAFLGHRSGGFPGEEAVAVGEGESGDAVAEEEELGASLAVEVVEAKRGRAVRK